jgi:iron complex transport system substrate-binding protein
MDLASLDLKQIDLVVSERVGQGGSVYAVDEEAIRKVSPTLIVTQDLCQVCAPSGNEATQALKSLKPSPEFLWQTPHSFEDVLGDIRALGTRTGTQDRAEALIARMRERVGAVAAATQGLPRRRVFFMEWVDPIFGGGHWVPEMLAWAGGVDGIAKAHVDSVRIPWERVLEWDPEVLVVSPCGFNAHQALEQAKTLSQRPGWKDISAVKTKEVFAVDANSYFAKPGPRLADGVELLGHLLHPEKVVWKGHRDAFFPL